MGAISGGNIIEGHPAEGFALGSGTSEADKGALKGRQLYFEALAGPGGIRQGALNVQINRASDQAITTWDGNPDVALKIIATNRADNTASNGALRGFDVQARNRGANISGVFGMNVNARNDSGKQAVELKGIDVRVENYGNVGTDIVGIDVNLSDENSNVDAHTKHGILIRNTDQSGMGAADAALKVSHTSTNGFAAFAELATNAGDGAVASIDTPDTTTTEALIVKIGSNLRYIPCYANATFGA